MRVTVPSALFVTQIEPAPAAIADGTFPTATDSTTCIGSGVDSQDDPVGADDPDRPERRERRPHRSAEEPDRRQRSGFVAVTTVIARVDLRDVAGARGHPDRGSRGGERPSACRRSECVATACRDDDVDASSRSGRRGSRPTTHPRPTRSRPVGPRPQRSPRSNRTGRGRRSSSAATVVACDSAPRVATRPATTAAVTTTVDAATTTLFRVAMRATRPVDPRSTAPMGAASGGGASAVAVAAVRAEGASSRPR